MDEWDPNESPVIRTTSEAVTRQVRVYVEAEYSSAHSSPVGSNWFFLYTVQISNEGDETVQLISRHWIITDATEHVEEVRGLGVVGKQPVLEPGDSFEYTSGCPLNTPVGHMHGTYQMVTASGERFEITIAEFQLKAPYTVH